MFRNILWFIVLGSLIIGCAIKPVGLAPSANYVEKEQYEILGYSSATAGHFSLFGAIPFGKANIDGAVKEAINKKDGDNLINVCYWQKTTWVLIGTLTSFEIGGDVIKYTTTAGQPVVPTVQTPVPKPTSMPIIQSPSPKPAIMPNIHNVSLGITGRYERGLQKGFSGLNITYRGRNPDKLYYFFPAVTLATMSKEIEFISLYRSSYGSSYKIGNKVLSISGGIGLNLRRIKDLSSLLPPNLNPYFEWGLGYALTSYRQDFEYDTFSDRDWFALTWNAGLGVEYWLTEQTAIDLYFNRQHIIDFGDEDFHYWKANLALTFRQQSRRQKGG